MIVNNTDIFGRKVFFIAPDDLLVPLSYMEDFCTLGYETHIIPGGFHMRSDVDIIVREFPDSILFFNVDADSGGSGWTALITDIRQDCTNLLVGIIFKADGSHSQQTESRYGNIISPQAGCIALSSNGSGNFQTLKAALDRCGAKGRRNNIRALCDSTSRISFSFGGWEKSEKIEDVNISHFRCMSSTDDFHGMKIYDKIRGAHLNINGLEFKSDIVLIMKRTKEGISTAVFMFIKKPDDGPGLEPQLEPQLNKKIYQITSQEFTALLHR